MSNFPLGLILGLSLGLLITMALLSRHHISHNYLYDHNGSALSIPAYQKYVIDRQAEELKEKIR
jgi:hypothetical protein